MQTPTNHPNECADSSGPDSDRSTGSATLRERSTRVIGEGAEVREKERHDALNEFASTLLEKTEGAGFVGLQELQVRAHQSSLARDYREGLGRLNTPRALVQEQVKAGSGSNSKVSASSPEPKSKIYENYPVGGWATDEHRYLFKNCFAGAKKRKRFNLLMIPAVPILLIWVMASMWLGISHFGMNAFDLAILGFTNATIFFVVVLGLAHRTKTRVGTFVCELRTTVKDGKTQRRFKCLDLRSARPETVAMGPYAPEDLELRVARSEKNRDLALSAELRLNISGAAPHEPETIILLGAPTLAHGLSPKDVVEVAHDLRVHQGIESRAV